MKKIISILIVSLLFPCLALSQSVQGTWKLIKFDITVDDQLLPDYFGKTPTGYLIFTAKRMMTIITKEGRIPGRSDVEKVALFNSLLAYSGPYRVEGGRYVIDIDASWNQAWNGTHQTRTWWLEDNRLINVTSPAPFSLDPTKTATAKLTWEKIE